VAERGDDTSSHQERVVGGDGADHIAEREQAHQRQQQDLAIQPAGRQGHERRADQDAQGVAADQEARDGDRYVEPVGDHGQEAHRRKFRRADAEGADRQRNDRPVELQGLAPG
jgi:hypothetical protein